MNYLINIIPFLIIGVILYFSLKKEKKKHDEYFGKIVSNKNEKPKIIKRQINLENHIKFDNFLPNPKELQNLCISISALEAILSQDWESRYYSYQKNWSDNEEICEMRNGSGDHILILFSSNGTVINGFAHESEMNIKYTNQNKKTGKGNLIQGIWKGVVDDLPNVFNDFIFGEPVKSIGTTFCIWQTKMDNEWKTGKINYPNDEYKDGSKDLMELLDGNPYTYKKFAEEYYYEEELELKIKPIEKIYNGIIITKELVLDINPEVNDFEQLKADLDEIGYKNKL